MTSEPEAVADLLANPFDNVYWFARMFVSTDQYGGVGTDNKRVSRLVSVLGQILPGVSDEPDDIEGAKQAIFGILKDRRPGTAKYAQVESLCAELDQLLVTKRDLAVLALTLEHVIVPTNYMLAQIPESDVQFAEITAKSFLEAKGEQGVKDVINIWDQLGTKGCLEAERAQIVQGFSVLRSAVNTLGVSRNEADSILTAFVQEFERRAGQKRKGRAGGSLADVTGLILKHFGIEGESPSADPQHITRQLEMDRIVTNAKGRKIGISCKRTSRERWKQIRTSPEVLEAAKFDEMWAVVTYDRDLSNDKVRTLGKGGFFFYLPDDSQKCVELRQDSQLGQYVRPLSQFVTDLRNFLAV